MDIRASLNDVRDLLETDASPIRFVIRTDPNLPWVRCCRIRSQNAVLNLVLNAQEALPASLVALRVADNGAGLDPAALARAFEPFFITKQPWAATVCR